MLKEKLIENKNKLVVAGSAALASAATTLPVLASESSGTANADVVSAMTTVANDMVATGKAIIPVALTVVGLILVVKFGLKVFRGVAK